MGCPDENDFLDFVEGRLTAEKQSLAAPEIAEVQRALARARGKRRSKVKGS